MATFSLHVLAIVNEAQGAVTVSSSILRVTGEFVADDDKYAETPIEPDVC